MKVSSIEKVRDLYEDSAKSYSEMMDAEINLPIYSDILSRLAKRIINIAGPIVDTSCGSGHMLHLYRNRYDAQRQLIGLDLSPTMIELSKAKLSHNTKIFVGDMRCIPQIESGSSSAVLSFFAIHHLDSTGTLKAFKEWSRILRTGGQLVVAAWEGFGYVDYEGESDLLARRYSETEIKSFAKEAGFEIDKCVIEPVEGFTMKALYLETTK